jgi:diadenosine tetraphosphatase ApaH/serine/threonine PP2A family protein phosphatase
MSRVLIISDIHANLAALETVLNDAEGQYDALWCLGDLVGYGPRPNECIELVRERAELCVMGNHDWAVLDKPGVNVEDFNPQARHAVLWTREQLSEENRRYLEQLPCTPVHPPKTSEILVTHASPREPVWEYILTPSIALENFAVFDDLLCLVGHTHVPAVFTQAGEAVTADPLPAGRPLRLRPDRRYIVNVGSVGQPRDGDPRAAYLWLDTDSREAAVVRLEYPVERTQRKMRAAGLPAILAERLAYGR